MIQSFKIVNYLHEELFLDIKKPEDTGFLVTSVTGLNYPDIEISSQTYAAYDGVHFSSVKVKERNIVVYITFYEDNKEKLLVEDLRWKLLRYFLPKSELTFYAINEHGIFWIKGYIESTEINIFSNQEKAQISILCPDPYWTQGTEDKIVRVGLVEPLFHFPVSIESSRNINAQYTIVDNGFGGKDFFTRANFEEVQNSGSKNYTINGETVNLSYNGYKAVAKRYDRSLIFGKVKEYPSTIIDYPGSAPTGVLITIEALGNVRNLRINNATRGEYVEINDSRLNKIITSNIRKGDQIIINTQKGKKSATFIRDGDEYNILDACMPIKMWPQLQTGENVFTYSTTTEINLVDIYVTYSPKFLGI